MSAVWIESRPCRLHAGPTVCPHARGPSVSGRPLATKLVSEVHFIRRVCGCLRFGLSRTRAVCMRVLLVAHTRGVRRRPDARWPKLVSEVAA